jgi:ABC-type glycerol-3-phosphate transport system substrate-binding protein
MNTNRNRFALLCAVVLLCGLLASCSGIELDYVEEDEEITADMGEGIGDTPEPVGEEPPANTPADPVIDLPPQTDSLTLYIPNMQYWKEPLLDAVAEYEKAYPDVAVTVETTGEEVENPYSLTGWQQGVEQYRQRVTTELMVGSGPDVVLIHKDIFTDIRRTLDSGAFVDLNPFMEQDEEFDMSVLNQAVMDAGVYKGRRYLMPYSYCFPSLFGIRSKLDAVGFDAAQNTDFVSLFEELNAVLPKAQENPAFLTFFSTTGDTERTLGALDPSSFLSAALRAADPQLLDYERETALPDEAGLKAFCEVYKPYWQSWVPGTTPDSDYCLHFNDRSFFNYSMPIMQMAINGISQAKGSGFADDYALLPFRALDGGITAEIDCALAVSAASQNQRNAWNFVRMMYGLKQQVGRVILGAANGIPVRKNTVRMICQQLARMGSDSATGSPSQVEWAKLSAKEFQPALDLYQSPVDCVIPTSADVLVIFEECMTPYFSDEASYEECVENLRRKLSLYVSE